MGLREFLGNEWRQLARVNRSDRPWEMPVAAALAIGLPIFVGAAHDRAGLRKLSPYGQAGRSIDGR